MKPPRVLAVMILISTIVGFGYRGINSLRRSAAGQSADAPDFRDCETAEATRSALEEEAFRCEADDDCQSTCSSAIGKGAAADAYLAADRWHARYCAAGERLLVLGYGKSPVCVEGRCTLR